MGRTIRLFFYCILALAPFSCQSILEEGGEAEQINTPILKADITSVIVPAEEEGTAPTCRTVMITSSMSWTASLDPDVDWVEVDKKSYANPDGKVNKALLVLSFQKYEVVNTDRSTTLKIKGDGQTIDVTIRQIRTKAYVSLLGDVDVPLPSAKPSQSTVSFRSNTAWTARIEEGASAQASLSASSGVGDGEIVVSFGENEDTESEKEATLVISAEELEEPVRVHFVQPKAIPVVLTASVPEVKVPASMPDQSTVTGTLTITSNVSWTAVISPAASWVSVAPASQENETLKEVATQVTLTFQDYDNMTANRAATLVVETTDGKKKVEVAVIQNKKEAFVQFVSGDTDYVGSAAGSVELSFISTGDWTASLEDAADGITLPVTSGTKDVNKLTVNFGEYMCAGASRSATVVLTSASGISDRVQVRQLGTELYLDFSGGKQPFTTSIAAGTMITETETEYILTVDGKNYSFVFYAKGGYTYINKPDGQTCGINFSPNDKNSWIKLPGVEGMKLVNVNVFMSNLGSTAKKGLFLREDPNDTANQVQNWDFEQGKWGSIAPKSPEAGKSYYMVGGNKSIIFSKLHLIYEY